jgi:adenylate kinase
MRVAVTGTPGTGKTTAVEAVETDLDVIHLNDVIKREGLTTGRDDERDTLVADVDALDEWLSDREDVLFESHLAHQFDADRVVVLRCRPDKLESRLTDRGESATTAAENAESEALDLILSETVNRHGEESVYEVDTTDKGPEAVAADIEAVLAGEREPSAGTVSFVDYL